MKIPSLLLAVMALLPISARGQAAEPVRVFAGLSLRQPVGVEFSRKGRPRLFVVEQRGTVRALALDHPEGAGVAALDITDRVDSSASELGLLGLALDESEGRAPAVYLNYTTANPLRTRISRIRFKKGSDIELDSASETVVLEYEQPYTNHNGGQLQFGPDGYLYIASGDGGSAGDPEGNAQNKNSLLGKILRIDVHRRRMEREYEIPRGNPFPAGPRPEIFAYGLRNPWRFSFDRKTGELYAADVGQNAFEEIDLIRSGGNYGWNITEGEGCFQPKIGCDRSGLEPPLITYGRNDGMSVTGGFVYRGEKLAALRGRYLFGDFVTGRIWYFDPGSPDRPLKKTLLLDTEYPISSFGQDREGELYIVSYGAEIYRLSPSTRAG